ncbi:MAG: type I 3-dehydroquinate dehydratase [Chloroflexota bacterium]
MKKPKICAVLVNADPKGIRDIEPLVELFEVRIDLIGDGWPGLVTHLRKPWIACNRTVDESGQWQGSEARRIEQLLQAIELGADMIDIELRTANLDNIVKVIKKRTKCLLSFHDIAKTPSLDEMKAIVERQLKAGADICKVVTTARTVTDNLTVLRLFPEFLGIKLVAFAMGPLGVMSRVFCPLAGSEFIYASIESGKESASGQMTVRDLVSIYEMVRA